MAARNDYADYIDASQEIIDRHITTENKTLKPSGEALGLRALIVGAGNGGRLLSEEIRRNPEWGFTPIGFVDDNPRLIGKSVGHIKVLGPTSLIPDLVQAKDIEAVILAIPTADRATQARLGDLARQSSARVLTMPDLGAILRGDNSATSIHEIRPADFLNRPSVSAHGPRCTNFISGKRVLITGAAGSIGSELTRQVAQLAPSDLILLDTNETGLYDLELDLQLTASTVQLRMIVGTVTNMQRMDRIIRQTKPDIIFHAAAYKHVPLMEQNPDEAVWTNVIGTPSVAEAAARHGVSRFVLVSTDKAVRPSSVMGATKRLAELEIASVAESTGLSTCCVRFGNVLGSRGSVIPTFNRQIDAGGPVKITDPAMMRYFMTIPEASSLIIEAGALGDRGAIYMLDMGEEVSILSLAHKMIRARGLRIDKDIEIQFTGMRPGEKLREELNLPSEAANLTPNKKIRRLTTSMKLSRDYSIAREQIESLIIQSDNMRIRPALLAIIASVDGVQNLGQAARQELAMFAEEINTEIRVNA